MAVQLLAATSIEARRCRNGKVFFLWRLLFLKHWGPALFEWVRPAGEKSVQYQCEGHHFRRGWAGEIDLTYYELGELLLERK
jgi:hypothetical protein